MKKTINKKQKYSKIPLKDWQNEEKWETMHRKAQKNFAIQCVYIKFLARDIVFPLWSDKLALKRTQV